MAFMILFYKDSSFSEDPPNVVLTHNNQQSTYELLKVTSNNMLLRYIGEVQKIDPFENSASFMFIDSGNNLSNFEIVTEWYETSDNNPTDIDLNLPNNAVGGTLYYANINSYSLGGYAEFLSGNNYSSIFTDINHNRFGINMINNKGLILSKDALIIKPPGSFWGGTFTNSMTMVIDNSNINIGYLNIPYIYNDALERTNNQYKISIANIGNLIMDGTSVDYNGNFVNITIYNIVNGNAYGYSKKYAIAHFINCTVIGKIENYNDKKNLTFKNCDLTQATITGTITIL